MDARLRFRICITALAAVFIIGTVGYMLVSDASMGDAAFMTVITLSTVGYGETIPLDPSGRIWTVVVIVLGVGVVSLAYASMLTLFVGGEIRTALGRSKVQAKIDQLHGHIILCGFGRMGAMSAQILRRQSIDLVVLEVEESLRKTIELSGALCVIGDATEESTLKKAGIERARSLVSALTSDAANVYVTLTARGMQPGLHIVSRAEQPSAEIKLRRAGADRVICPPIIGATRIANILTKPNVVDFFEVAAQGVDLEMDEYSVGPHSAFRDKTLKDSDFRQKIGAMIVAIKRADGSSVFQPGPDEVLREGDQLILVGQGGTSALLDQLG